MAQTYAAIPIVPMRGLVVLPGELINFEVGREKSKAAILAAMNGDRAVCLFCQHRPEKEEATASDIFDVGTLCRIRNMSRRPDGSLRVLAEGISRCTITAVIVEDPYINAEVQVIPESIGDEVRAEALKGRLSEAVKEYARVSGKLSKELLSAIDGLVGDARFSDAAANAIALKTDERQKLLETSVVSDRMDILYGYVLAAIESKKIDMEVEQQVKARIEKNQREYYLREKVKVIRAELGDDEELEADKYRAAMEGKRFPKEYEERLRKEINRLSELPAGSHEGPVARTYIECLLGLPYYETTKDSIDLNRARRILDKDHYGLEKVKDRIIEHLAVARLTGKLNGQVLCFIGPPGVGKTSITESVAAALGRRFVRMSLGGIHDESEIRGHRRTYIGAMPGRIMSAMAQAGTTNPVLLFDEIDKLGSDHKGDPASAMLEVLDTAQNHAFRDHFVELPYDLSNVMFITTANNYDGIPPMLLDRMEVIDVSGYLRSEKVAIAQKHLIPKQLKKHGLTAAKLRIPADCIGEIIDRYTAEAGVRNLERCIASICRKAAVSVANDGKAVRLTHKQIPTFLGQPKRHATKIESQPLVGLVNGLAWTAVGGDVLEVEAQTVPGDGKIIITGHVGQVMEESARAAVTFVKANGEVLGVPDGFFADKDIHIHIPEGATPKDGPSAGVTMATAVASIASGMPVKAAVAMTGEITLRGRVLPIGGLREKLMAAVRSGVTTVIIPADNACDLDEVPEEAKSALDIVLATTAFDVIEAALLKKDDVKMTSEQIGVGNGVQYGRVCN